MDEAGPDEGICGLEGSFSRRGFLQRGGALALGAGALGASLTAGAAQAAPLASKATNLGVWSWQTPVKGGYIDLFTKVFKNYEKANSGFKIKYTEYAQDDYFTKFHAALLGGQGIPDMMEMEWSGRYHQLIDSKSLVRLDPYLKSGFPKFFPNVPKQMTYKGGQYGVAMDENSINMGVNLDMLKAHGIAVPQSRADLIAAAKTLQSNGMQGLAVPILTDWARGDMFFSQLAYIDKTDLALREAEQGKRKWTDPVFLQAAQAVEELRDAGVFADSSNGLDITGAIQAWTSEKAAFFWGYVAPGIPAFIYSFRPQDKMFAFDFNPTPPPSASVKPRSVGGAAIIWSIPAKSKNIPAAVALMKQFTTASSARQMDALNLIPSYGSKIPSTSAALFKKSARVEQTVASRSIFNANVELALTNSMSDLLNGKMTAAQLVSALQDAA